MSEPSFRLFVNRIIYLCFLWLFGLMYLITCLGDDSTRELPLYEVLAVNVLAYQFKSKVTSTTLTTGYCKQTASSTYGFNIGCDNCTDVNRNTCHINVIMFSGLGMTGTINEAVGDLRQLAKLQLADNDLHGTIPTSLGNLEDLETLDLSNNQLTGRIPENLGSLKELKWLYLHNNLLEGIIPPSLGELVNLEQLFLNFNLLSGSISHNLGNLSNLQKLDLGENELSGNLPESLGNLSYLTYFWVPSNYLTGDLPQTYSQLHRLITFGVAGNYLTGHLPQFVTNWSKIEILSFVGNYFEGNIPNEYFHLPNLQYLWISDLIIRTYSELLPLPSNGTINKIFSLVLRNCSIKGSIPPFIHEAPGIQFIDLSFNNLTGQIPESWQSNLIYMSLARNQLSGIIPTWILKARGARMDLSYNHFSEIAEPLPPKLDLNLFSCCCCKNSEIIQPYMLRPSEMLDAYFPRKKPKFYSLYINCGGEQTMGNGKLYDADDTDDATFGWYVSPMKNWAYSYSGDFLTATVNASDYKKTMPYKISNSKGSVYEDARLSPVSLKYYGLGLRKGNYSVILDFAEIVYSETDHNRLRKRVFDIYIQGKLVLKNFNIKEQALGPNSAINRTYKAEVQNDGDPLEIHFYWSGKGSNFDNPPVFNGPLISAISVTNDFPIGGGLSPLDKALISIASIVIALLLLLSLAWKMGWLESKELKKNIEVGNGKTVKLRDIIKATKNISNEIGHGSLGTVYLARVGKDHNVAVKRLSSDFWKSDRSDLENQILHMKILKHNNLLNVLDVHIGKRHKLLIYEYMEHRSLQDIFFGDSKSPKMELDWATRYNICLGIARGLKLLHENKKNIIHGNIKTSNILLDGMKEAKLSDYGLAAVYTDENRLLQIKEEAPKGFHPIDYFQGRVSKKSDVYSFGRSSEVDRADQKTEYLLDEAYALRKESNLTKLVDENLNGVYDARQVITLLKLALRCTSSAPRGRPTISEVFNELLLNKLTIQGPTSTSNDGDRAIVRWASI